MYEKVTFSALKVTFRIVKVIFSSLKVTFRNVKVTFSPLKVTLSCVQITNANFPGAPRAYIYSERENYPSLPSLPTPKSMLNS